MDTLIDAYSADVFSTSVMTRFIDTSLDNKRRRESESEVVAKKPRKDSSWKGKRERKDMETAEYMRKHKNLNRGLYFSQVCWPSINVRSTGTVFFTPLTLKAILVFFGWFSGGCVRHF